MAPESAKIQHSKKISEMSIATDLRTIIWEKRHEKMLKVFVMVLFVVEHVE